MSKIVKETIEESKNSTDRNIMSRKYYSSGANSTYLIYRNPGHKDLPDSLFSERRGGAESAQRHFNAARALRTFLDSDLDIVVGEFLDVLWEYLETEDEEVLIEFMEDIQEAVQ